MPARWAARLALGLLLAAAALAVLQWSVGAGGARDAAAMPRPDGPMLAAAALPRGTARMVAIATQRAALPEGCAPVLAIGRGGSLRVVVPPPPPAGPLAAPWPASGVLLPCRELAALDARARARLLEVLGALVGPGALAAGQIALADVEAKAGELEALLRWLR
jgi:hypothetical protein